MSIENFIRITKANIAFIEHRLKVQSDSSYSPFKIISGIQIRERQYSLLDIEVLKDKLAIAELRQKQQN